MEHNENTLPTPPKHYLLCYNDACELAPTCLRRLAADCDNLTDRLLQVVNPKLNNGKTCRYYKEKKTVRLAYGMLTTFDKVLANDIATLRGALISHFGNGSYYLRRNCKQPITPDEQQYISRKFRENGYPEGAQFDRYEDGIEW